MDLINVAINLYVDHCKLEQKLIRALHKCTVAPMKMDLWHSLDCVKAYPVKYQAIL